MPIGSSDAPERDRAARLRKQIARLLAIGAAMALLAAWLRRGDDISSEPARFDRRNDHAQASEAAGPSHAKRRARGGADPTRRSFSQPEATPSRSAITGAAGAAAIAPRVPRAREPEPVFGELVARWQAESVDTDWTRAVEDELRASMSALAVRVQILDVSCRSTLCRAQLAFADAGEAGRYASDATDPARRRWFTTRATPDRFEVDVVLPREAAGAP